MPASTLRCAADDTQPCIASNLTGVPVASLSMLEQRHRNLDKQCRAVPGFETCNVCIDTSGLLHLSLVLRSVGAWLAYHQGIQHGLTMKLGHA